MKSKTIMVLGDGIGGVVAASKLGRLLKEDRIVVVDQSPAHMGSGRPGYSGHEAREPVRHWQKVAFEKYWFWKYF